MTGALLAWFQQQRRALPWRQDRTPYRVWVSEVMLQQTQVETVKAYFERWMARFPTLATLAASPLDEVLQLWEGLGYYRRARNLHRSARIIVRDHGGTFPRHPDSLRALPGIGRYTANAVASIAFGEPVVAVDANVQRVGARLLARASPSRSEIERYLGQFIDRHQPGDFNEALMDLGSMVCRATNPQCAACPLRSHCGAFATGNPTAFPARRARSPRPRRRRYALVWLEQDHILLHRRPQEGMLPGLWGFVQTPLAPAAATILTAVNHDYSHFQLTVAPALLEQAPAIAGTMVPLAALDRLALSKVDRKILAALASEDVLPTSAS